MVKCILENGLKVKVWVDDFPIESKQMKGKYLSRAQKKMWINSKQLVVELFIPRDHNNYALLGIEFIPDNEKQVKIKMSIENEGSHEYNTSIAPQIDTVTWGIFEEYKHGIMNSFNKFLKNGKLPSGTIYYNIFAQGEIGSSQNMFEMVSDILLSLLTVEHICESTVMCIVKQCMGTRE